MNQKHRNQLKKMIQQYGISDVIKAAADICFDVYAQAEREKDYLTADKMGKASDYLKTVAARVHWGAYK